MNSEAGKGKSRDELIAELQIYQLELEMQNEQLSYSYQSLEEESSKFASFFDLAPFGYFVLDHKGNLEEVNQTAIDLLGTSKKKLFQKSLQLFIDHEYSISFVAFLERIKDGANKQKCEVKVTDIKKKSTYMRMEGLSITNSRTGNLQYYITAIDITTQKLAQQRLYNTKQRLEMTLRASETGTWTLELHTQYLSLDDYCFSILELDFITFDGHINTLINIIHPDDQKRVREAWRISINDFLALDIEFRILTKHDKIKHISAKGHRVVNVSANYFAGTIMDVSHRRLLEEEKLNLKNEKQRLILAATFDAQEKERFRLSNALHDSVCQLLYGIRLNLQVIGLSSDKKNELNKAMLLLDEAIQETREISYELTPSVLRDFGFAAGIKEISERLSSQNMTIFSHVDPVTDSLDTEVQLYLFRMVQELINNCLNHANATEVKINVSMDAGQIILNVIDNGHGFQGNIEEMTFNGSGLRSIKNRIFLLGGTLDLKSSEEGAAVSIRFRSNQPITKHE